MTSLGAGSAARMAFVGVALAPLPTIAGVADALTLVSSSPEETRRIGECLGRSVDEVRKGGLWIAVTGDLGAGKTVLASGVVRGLGVPPSVTVQSPTFTLVRSYLGRVPVHHVDAFLVTSLRDLEASGFEILREDRAVVVVEWAERIREALPEDHVTVVLTPTPARRSPEGEPPPGGVPAGDPPRRLEISASGPRSERVVTRLHTLIAADVRT